MKITLDKLEVGNVILYPAGSRMYAAKVLEKPILNSQTRFFTNVLLSCKRDKDGYLLEEFDVSSHNKHFRRDLYGKTLWLLKH